MNGGKNRLYFQYENFFSQASFFPDVTMIKGNLIGGFLDKEVTNMILSFSFNFLRAIFILICPFGDI